MLQTIKTCIDNLSAEPFAVFYQRYVMQVQDMMIESRVRSDSYRFTSLEDTGAVIRGLNLMTEELKKL